MKPEIRKAAEILRAGGLVAFPTETVYGSAPMHRTPGRWRVFTRPSAARPIIQ